MYRFILMCHSTLLLYPYHNYYSINPQQHQHVSLYNGQEFTHCKDESLFEKLTVSHLENKCANSWKSGCLPATCTYRVRSIHSTVCQINSYIFTTACHLHLPSQNNPFHCLSDKFLYIYNSLPLAPTESDQSIPLSVR